MRHVVFGTFCALVLLTGSVPATAATVACYDWDCTWSTRHCTFDAGCSSASPSIASLAWNFGDGTTEDPGATTTSHTYNPPGNDCFFNVTLTVRSSGTDPDDSVTCEVIFKACPIGPQGPNDEEIFGQGRCQ